MHPQVYAFAILLWELYTGGHAYQGTPRALLVRINELSRDLECVVCVRHAAWLNPAHGS